MNSKLSKPELLALLAILSFALIIRLGGLSLPLVFPDDWGHAIFLLFARNYADYGFLESSTIPYFGYVGDHPYTYSNHPWLVPLILAFWGIPFGHNEFSYRSLAIVFSVASVAAVFFLGRRLKGLETGVMAATIFASAPLSIHVGRTYCLELVHVCFILWFLVALCRWRAGDSSWHSCALLLCLTQMSDIFGLFVSLWLFGFALFEWRKQRPWKPLFGVACVPIFVQASIVALLVTRGSGSRTLDQSVGRAGGSWDYWFTLQYWTQSVSKVSWNYSYIVPAISLVGLLWLVRGKLVEVRCPHLVMFWWYFPVLYTILGAYWFARHNHLALFYGPALALTAAVCLARMPRWLGLSTIVCHLAISGWLYSSIFHQPQRFHYEEIKYAYSIRSNISRADLVVGLPPHIAYYVRHRNVLPWNAFLKASLKEEDVGKSMRPLFEHYQRVIIFPQFIEWPDGVQPLDFSRIFRGSSSFRLTSPQGATPVVWERVSDSEQR